MKSLTDYFLKNDLLSIKYLLRADLLWNYQVSKYLIIFPYFTSLFLFFFLISTDTLGLQLNWKTHCG